MQALKLDWLAFTYKVPSIDIESVDSSNQLVQFINKFPELQEFILSSVTVAPRFGYNKTLKFSDDFLILYNDYSCDLNDRYKKNENMGVNFQVPSHSLELFLSVFGIDIDDPKALYKIFSILYDRGCQLSRIDLCYDDYSKRFKASYYADKWMRGLFRTHFMQAIIYKNSSDDGNTFYLGSLKKRTKLLRIYDKYIESDGENDCVRYEFEYHAENARDVMAYVLGGGEIDFFPYLRSWFEIVEDNDLVNKAQKALDSEWEEFFTESVFCEKITIPRYSKEQRIKEVTHFINHQVFPSLKGYVALYGWEYVKEQVKISDMNNKYKDLLDSSRYKDVVGWLPAVDCPYC